MPLLFGSPEANRWLEIDKGRKIAMSVYPTGYVFDDAPDQDRYCAICGGYMDWIDCWQCGGEGEFDMYEDDPMWYEPGDFEDCDVCRGAGGYWECASLPHESKEVSE